MIFILTIIAEPEIELGEELLQGICSLKLFNFDVVKSTSQMLIDPCFGLLAK